MKSVVHASIRSMASSNNDCHSLDIHNENED